MTVKYWVGGVTGTLDMSNVANIALASGAAPSGGPLTPADQLIIDAASGIAGGTLVFGAGGLQLQAFTFGNMVGTLDAATFAPTIALSHTTTTFSGTGTGTRVLNLGASVWNITSTALSTIFNFTVITGLTVNAGTSVFNLLGNNNGRMTMNLGAGLTWSRFNFLGTGRGSYNLLANPTTINTVNIVGRQDMVWEGSRTFNIANLLIDGTDIDNMVNMAASDSTGIATIANASGGTFDYALFRRMAFTGVGAKVANNSIDLGLNTGITINPPAIGGGDGNTKYWNGVDWVIAPVNRFNGAAWEAA